MVRRYGRKSGEIINYRLFRTALDLAIGLKIENLSSSIRLCHELTIGGEAKK